MPHAEGLIRFPAAADSRCCTSQRCPLLGPFRSHFTICLFPRAPMETWISWHLMKISASIDAHGREKNMQKRTWRKNDTEGSHSFTHSAPRIYKVWHIIAGRVENECLCHSSFYESVALTYTQRLPLLLLGYSAYNSSRSSVLRNQALLRHGVSIVTRFRAGRSVVRIPTAEKIFFSFPKS